MSKKTKIYLVAFLVLVMSAGFGYKAFAQSTTSGWAMKSTTLLGINVLKTGSVRYSVVDATNQSSNQDITLPSVSGNDGMIYIVKVIDQENEYNNIGVKPQSGEKVDGVVDNVKYIGDQGSGEYAMYVDDEASGTWWLLQSGVNI